MIFDDFLQKVLQMGLEYFRIYYGTYRARVIDVNDPEDRGRIKVICPGVGQLQPMEAWISPAFLGAGRNRGWFWPPEVGDSVWVGYAQGQADQPLVYWGGWYGVADNQTEVPTELRPDAQHNVRKRGFVTRRGHQFIFNETTGEDAIELIWHRPTVADTNRTQTPARTGDRSYLKFNKDGGIELRDKNSNKITLDAQNTKIEIQDQTGNKITMNSSGVTVDCGTRDFTVNAQNVRLNGTSVFLGTGAAHPVPHGDSWLQWALTHTHGTGVGPSSPPLQPPTPTLNSTVSKTG